MPIIIGTTVETTNNANIVMARAFFPRAKE